MTMDPVAITLLATAATMIVGFGGIVVTIHTTAGATHRRVDDLRTDMDRRFEDMDRQLADLRIDFRDMRGRIDHIADSLSLGRARAKKRA